MIYYWTDAWQPVIYLLNIRGFFICLLLLYLFICLFHLFSEPQNITWDVEEGNELNMTCRNRRKTSSSVLWTRNGIPVQTGKSRFLYVKSINRTDAGNYICVSLSSDANHSSPITTVDVLCKFGLYLDYVKTEQLPKKSLSPQLENDCVFWLPTIITMRTINEALLDRCENYKKFIGWRFLWYLGNIKGKVSVISLSLPPRHLTLTQTLIILNITYNLVIVLLYIVANATHIKLWLINLS